MGSDQPYLNSLLEIGGPRLLTDPAFDPPGDHPVGNRVLAKTRGPALPVEVPGPIDAVLLSHDQHPDNLDHAGRQLIDQVPRILTTAEAAGRIGGTATASPPWRHIALPRPGGPSCSPARPGPLCSMLF